MKALLSRIHAKLGDLWWYTILLFVAQRFGDVINMFVGLWIVPKYVPMEELGAVLPLTQVVGLIGVPLTIISIPFLKFIAVFSERSEMGKVKALIRDAFVGTAILASASCLLAWMILPFFFERLRIQNGSLAMLLVAITIAGSVASIFTSAMDGLKKFRVLVWFQAISAPIRLLLMIVFMPFRALSGYVVGQSATPLTYIVGSVLALRKFLCSDVKSVPYWHEHGREMLAYTWPLVVSALVGAITGNMDTLVIRHRLPEFESAGYYIITRFSEISVWVGAAFTAFLFPMLAGKDGHDERSRKMLLHSVSGTAVVGLFLSVVLWLCGRRILGLRPEWSPYANLSTEMALFAVNGMLAMMATCFVATLTARGRFAFFLYYLPLVFCKSAFLYVLTGYVFFDGILPADWLNLIADFNPCRLIVVAVYMVASQCLVVGVLAVGTNVDVRGAGNAM